MSYDTTLLRVLSNKAADLWNMAIVPQIEFLRWLVAPVSPHITYFWVACVLYKVNFELPRYRFNVSHIEGHPKTIWNILDTKFSTNILWTYFLFINGYRA